MLVVAIFSQIIFLEYLNNIDVCACMHVFSTFTYTLPWQAWINRILKHTHLCIRAVWNQIFLICHCHLYATHYLDPNIKKWKHNVIQCMLGQLFFTYFAAVYSSLETPILSHHCSMWINMGHNPHNSVSIIIIIKKCVFMRLTQCNNS